MTSVFSATPPAGQPPTSADRQPAAQGFGDRWDWLRADFVSLGDAYDPD